MNNRKLLTHLAVICSVIVATLYMMQNCGANYEGSDLTDAATINSYKTGFFIPKSESEYRLLGKKKPISVGRFVAKARDIAGNRNLRLSLSREITYAVTVDGKGEQLLVIVSPDDVPLPALSIKDGRLFSWNQYVEEQRGDVALSDLFIKTAYGQSVQDYRPQDMYVRRMAINSNGVSEPVIVPWLNHVRSETGQMVTYRVGNTIIDARSGKGVLEFQRMGKKPIWQVVGPYKDPDVVGGTVFWRLGQDDFYSLKPGDQDVVVWKRQDRDSLDRLKDIPVDQAKIPKQVRAYHRALARSDSSRDPRKQPVDGFVSYEGDYGVFQLDRNSMVLVDRSEGGFGLAGAASDEVPIDDSDFVDEGDGFGLGLFSGNKPVQIVRGNGDNRAATWTDQDGEKRAGVILSDRNVWQDGGVFTSGKYQRRYYVLHRNSNTVSEVGSDGRVVRKNIPVSRFQNEARTNINMNRMQVDGGTVGRNIRAANKLRARSQRQLERSESKLGGDSVGESASRLLEDHAVAHIKAQAGNGQGFAVQQAIGMTGDAYGALRDGQRNGKGAYNIGMGVLQDPAKLQDLYHNKSVDITKDYVTGQAEDLLTKNLWRQGGVGALQAKKRAGLLGATVDGALDMRGDYKARQKKGDFDVNNPDYYFDSRIGYAGVAGKGVAVGAGTVLAWGQPPGSRSEGALKVAGKKTVGTLFDSTEALSRASYAITLEKERSHILEQSGQSFRDAAAGREALGVLGSLPEFNDGSAGAH